MSDVCRVPTGISSVIPVACFCPTEDMRVKGFFSLRYTMTDFLLSNYRLNDGNEYLFQAKDDVSF